MKLRELLSVFDNNNKNITYDVDLYHWDVDEEYPSVVDLSLSNFTPEGIKEFAEVLDSEVVRINSVGEAWFAIYVKGVKPSKLNEFCSVHAGYCSVEDYNKWFKMDNDSEEVV